MNREDLIQRLEDKLDTLDERLDKIDTTLVRNTISLEEHVRRCNLLEESVRSAKKEIEPLRLHMHKVQFFVKMLMFLIPVVVAIIYKG